MYSDKVKDHFMNPRNILEDEDSFQEDGKGVVGNMKCGDQMLIVIQVENNKITDCRWKTYGCASAIASTSMLSDVVKGMELEDAYKIKPSDIVDGLEGLPENKIHCSVLGDRALRAAIEDYWKRNGMTDKIQDVEAVTVCNCIGVTDKDIEEAVKLGDRTWEDLQKRTKIGTDCGECREKGEELLHQYVHLFGE
jgi:nitrogen fixation NifU-like protein